MAAGGWGGAYSNPFAGQVAAATAEQEAEKAASNRQQNAFGAWGGGLGSTGPTAPPPPSSLPFNLTAAAAGANGNIDAREAALQRREAELARREAELASSGASGGIRNWPPCCPFIYHNISEQIPSWNRSYIRVAFLVELISIAAFFYNTIIILATLLAGVPPGLSWFFLAFIALVLGVPLSWWLFYKSQCASAQTDGATYSYIRTFLLIMVHMAWCALMILGIPNITSFSAGVFPMLQQFQSGGSKGNAFGIMFIINICLWGLAGIGCWLCLGLSVKAYRRGDAPRRQYEDRVGGIQMNQA